ncbi:hypothetical protein HB852_09770 [Listeria grandensis]|uniref:immunoglobulin-like domain-containing protein n=1 Tax=Listeria grandensis TaxID=1494963 RepID=UPI0016242154|nr:immunoglobulin-like domain-containing protein [Listeria grandensis]MBC1474904.1 hypothetical protein [Listeria grandensis]
MSTHKAQVSSVTKYGLESDMTTAVSQKTRLPAPVMNRYLLDTTYATGTSIDTPSSLNARVYAGSQYLATGTITTGGAISIYMAGILGAYYAKSVSLEINGVVKPTVAVSQDGTYRYYAKNLITSTSDVVKVLLYNRGNTVMETLPVKVVSTSSTVINANNGSTANPYIIGENYVTGTFNTVYQIKALDGASSGGASTIEGMPGDLVLELPKLTVNPVVASTGVVSGTTENNGQVRVSVDGVAKTVFTADATGNYSGNISGITVGSIVKVEAKIGSYFPAYKEVTAT